MALACVAGYVWMFFNLQTQDLHGPGVCMIKNATGIPCPSCGSTRSIVALLQGDFLNAIYLNPLGILILSIMVVLPLWLIADVVTKRDSLFISYKKFESIVNKPRVAIPLVLLVAANWVWNIIKDL